MATDLTITQLITVGGTIGGALITAIVTIAGQYINKKIKENEIKQQLIFKVIDEELKERKILIKPLLQFIDRYNLPQNHDFFDDAGEGLERSIVDSYTYIKKELSDFMISYSVYMSNDVRNAIWDLSSSITQLQSLDYKHHNSSKSVSENNDILYMNCKGVASDIWSKLLSLREVLFREIRIQNIV